MEQEITKRKVKLSEIPIKQRNILIAQTKNKYITALLILLFGPLVYKFYLGKISEGIRNILLFTFIQWPAIFLLIGSIRELKNNGFDNFNCAIACGSILIICAVISFLAVYLEMFFYLTCTEEEFYKSIIKN